MVLSWIEIWVILALKRPKKTLSDLNFGPADNKNAIETQSMGGINIWDKSNFFRPFVSQKDAKKV